MGGGKRIHTSGMHATATYDITVSYPCGLKKTYKELHRTQQRLLWEKFHRKNCCICQKYADEKTVKAQMPRIVNGTGNTGLGAQKYADEMTARKIKQALSKKKKKNKKKFNLIKKNDYIKSI